MHRTLIVMLAFVHFPPPLRWILNLSTSFFAHSICLLVFCTLALSFLFLLPFFVFFHWFKYPVLINSFTCLHSISPGIGTAIQLSCTRLTRQSDADSCALSLGDGVVTFLWGSKLTVATPVRIIQYLWKMLGCSGEGIQRPPPSPPHTHISVARVLESGRRHQMWAPERFFSGYLSLPFQKTTFSISNQM